VFWLIAGARNGLCGLDKTLIFALLIRFNHKVFVLAARRGRLFYGNESLLTCHFNRIGCFYLFDISPEIPIFVESYFNECQFRSFRA
jgi:hypothetical protein